MEFHPVPVDDLRSHPEPFYILQLSEAALLNPLFKGQGSSLTRFFTLLMYTFDGQI